MEIISVFFLLIVFLAGIILAYSLGHKLGTIRRDRYWEAELPNQRKLAISQSRAVLGGQFSEQLAPYLPEFNFLPSECKFLGKPVDFLVFNGMDEKKIKEVVFVEVKSSKSQLSPQEKSLKETIQNKRVRWEEYRIPEGITKAQD